MYEYKLKIVKVIDGDTVDGIIDCGFDIFVKKRIRLSKINAPETRTRDKFIKARGMLAKDRLKQLLKESADNLTVKTELDKTGKFGRVPGVLFATHLDSAFQGRRLNINQQLLTEGLVEVYGKI